LVPKAQNAASDTRKIGSEEVKRILDVGKLLLSVLTQAEVDMLTRHLQQETPSHPLEHAAPDATGEKDQITFMALDAARNMEQS
jgi:hypothetical protein